MLKRMALRTGFVLLAERLQEAADALTASDIRSRLADAVRDCCRAAGSWGYYVDHIGDGAAGDVIYYCGDDMYKAPYEISGGADTAAKCLIDTAKAIDVVPRTIYQPEQDELDHFAAMEAEELYTKGETPLVERFVAKSERNAADAKSFAGKGKSFPILKKEDVKAAVASLGRAGAKNYGADVIRKNIKRIATEKGWGAELPTAWADGEQGHSGETEPSKEGAVPPVEETTQQESGTLADVALCESAAFAPLLEAATPALTPLVKIISPGRGSSGYYPKETLVKAAQDKIFKRGTLMYINHATPAEEAARPEGDYSKLAAVTTGDAYWDEAGKDGPALYAPAKVFAGFAADVSEKAPHTGVSIRARGKRDDKMVGADGRPGVIVELNHAESIDLVTKAGRDGKLLLESADADPNLTEGGDPMDATELKKLQEANRNIAVRFAEGDARKLAKATLASIRLPESAKTAIEEKVSLNPPLTEALTFDAAAFKPILEAEIQYAASFIPGGVQAVGVGAAGTPDPKVTEAQRERDLKERDFSLNRSAANMGIKSEAGLRIFREGRRAFDPNYCAKPVVGAEV